VGNLGVGGIQKEKKKEEEKMRRDKKKTSQRAREGKCRQI
jgi:hypothetical protein